MNASGYTSTAGVSRDSLNAGRQGRIYGRCWGRTPNCRFAYSGDGATGSAVHLSGKRLLCNAAAAGVKLADTLAGLFVPIDSL